MGLLLHVFLYDEAIISLVHKERIHLQVHVGGIKVKGEELL